MAFCSFSKDNENSYTMVENKFIAKYLPEADGFAVKVYLYGLYLCADTKSDFSLSSMSEVLKTTEEKIKEAFAVWEDYDLVQILAQEPFTVAYLPVKSAIGRPKKVRYEKYTDFNKELQLKMQKVGKFINAGEFTKYMRFLEENPMQPQAFLLVAEYCINKEGEAITPSYIFNKARKLLRGGAVTYEQVERELGNYHEHDGAITEIYNGWSIYGKEIPLPDYTLYAKWLEMGFSKKAILAAAKFSHYSMQSLDYILQELHSEGKRQANEIASYFDEKEKLTRLTYMIGDNLGAIIKNPTSYIKEYTQKWVVAGFQQDTLLLLSRYCLRNGYTGFEYLHRFIEKLTSEKIVGTEEVSAYIERQTLTTEFFLKIQAVCPHIRKSTANLTQIRTWKEWNFSDEMILEAAKRAATSASPIPYMQKILSAWKEGEIFEVKNIPSAMPTKGAGTSSSSFSKGYTNPSIEAANAKSERERYYSLLREKAQAKADKFVKKANSSARFKEITTTLSKMQFELAKAEVFEPTKLPALKDRQAALLSERKSILTGMGIEESQLLPQYACAKCEDTGFLQNGAACGCYKSAQKA